MEFISELKQDNALLWPGIEWRVNHAFAPLIDTHEQFEQDRDILLDYLRVPGRGIGGSLVLRLANLYNDKYANKSDSETIAIATEILNAGILILDDVVDDSDFRKRQPTVHKAYEHCESDAKMSRSKAIQLGAVTLSLASAVANDTMSAHGSSARENVLKSGLLVSAGQLLEGHVATNDELQNTRGVLAVHKYKTGHYSFESPMRSGLLLARAPFIVGKQFGEIAQHLGLTFQLQDDINGVFGDAEVTGKPNRDDIRLGLHTMLTNVAVEKLPHNHLLRFKQLHGKADITEAELEECRALLTQNHVPEVVGKMAVESLDRAEELLDAAWENQWNPAVRAYLESIIAFLRLKQPIKA